jgi:hypothetical protein
MKIFTVNPLNAELNAICHLLALLGAHHILHVSRIRVKHSINKRREFYEILSLSIYIYIHTHTYRVIQEESALLWEMIV